MTRSQRVQNLLLAASELPAEKRAGEPESLKAARAAEVAKFVSIRDDGKAKGLYVKRADGTRVYATIDERQVDEAKISAVHFLKFAVGVGAEVVAIGCDDPAIAAEAALAPEARAALAMDLSPDA